jgi:RHS repeat-associated protein
VQYGYTQVSNMAYANNLVNSAFSELYSYDNLQQLTNFARGVLSAGLNSIANPTYSQSFSIGANGNFTNVTTNGTAQARTSNQANQITSIAGASAPTYDAAGNMKTDDRGYEYTYNAWNQITQVRDSNGKLLATYVYDALGRRITQTENGSTTDLYYDGPNVIEERVNGTPTTQYVWSPTGGQAPVEMDITPAGGTPLSQRLYVLQDPNGSVVALLNTSGQVVERYAYSAYGQVMYLAPDWSTRAKSSYGTLYLFQSGRLDPATGLYHFGGYGGRDLSSTMGVWLQQDPMRFNAGTNFYEGLANNPTTHTDPTGLDVWESEGDGYVSSGGDFGADSVITADVLGGMASYVSGQSAPPTAGQRPTFLRTQNTLAGAAGNQTTFVQIVPPIPPRTVAEAALDQFNEERRGRILQRVFPTSFSYAPVACTRCHAIHGFGRNETPPWIDPVTGRIVDHALLRWNRGRMNAQEQLKLEVAAVAAGTLPRLSLRSLSGVASGGRQLPAVNGQWLTEGVGGFVPPSVAKVLRGQTFRDWNHFRQEFWIAVSKDAQLARQFSLANQARMAEGLAPVAPRSLQYGQRIEYQIHHIEAIERGGAVYNLDNLIVLAPRTHMGIHNPQVFVPSYRPR